MDLLDDALALAGVRGTAALRIEAGRGWGITWARNADAVLYAVAAGNAWVTAEGADGEPLSVDLGPGDVVLLPTGVAHSIADDAHRTPRPCDTAATDDLRRVGEPLRLGAGESRTRLLGASYRHDRVVSLHVLNLLPPVVHIRANRADGALDDTVRMITRETASPRPGTQVVLDRLVDIVLVQVLRGWLDSNPGLSRGSWIGALADPLVSDAMVRMHERPARPWTTERLAQELAVSRSTLTRRFQDATGQNPAEYLTRWRMDLAARQLRDTDTGIDTVARSVGYTSVHAFNRAFHRTRGLPPARFRTTSRETPVAAAT
ncbi:AraC family transcriptional regulator [Actinacidiphila yeochonensis]|uniref:AraC family transcriptional regulator n=1 Tax=Actinacidiphila yeochonensis TaxID=89050 RepID=UPI000564C84E|nr:AraC family transcriptional regulator [Actinacidiphila yeochonensis]